MDKSAPSFASFVSTLLAVVVICVSVVALAYVAGITVGFAIEAFRSGFAVSQ